MREYSFLNTVVLVNGFEITGWAEGDDVIQMERLNDSAGHSIGADGEMTVAVSADRSGMVKMMLQQTSESNALLSGLVNAQENGAFVPVFIQFKDTRGNDLASGTQGYIQRPANMQRGTGVNSQEWNVIVERLDMLVGGSEAL
jgi:hypothetical protein